MNGILGMVDLLLATEQTPEQETYANAIEQSGRTLLVLIDEILDFSKIEAGKIELRAAPFDLEACVRDAVELLATKGRQKGLEIAWTLDASVPRHVLADEARIRQVLLNLIGNAVKFTDRGGVLVSVTARRAESGQSRIAIRVEDTGVGLDRQALAGLFGEFEQVDTAGRGRPAGTGLGLAISRRLARAMGGEIAVESEAGRGSAFTFELPVGIHDGSPALAAAPPMASEMPSGGAPSGLRVLIAEDNPINALLAQCMVRRAGCASLLVEDGRAAVEALEHCLNGTGPAIDLVLMDVHMPVLDGLQAAREVRRFCARLPGSDRGRSCPPLIAVTASAFPEDRKKCLEAGMNDYLSKPFSWLEFQALLARWLPQAETAACPGLPEATMRSDCPALNCAIAELSYSYTNGC